MKNIYHVNNCVREYRLKYGLSQEQLSFLCGLSQNSISDIENGKYNVSVYNALKLANVLFCSVEDLFSIPDDELYN